MKTEKIRVRLIFIDSILGSEPGSAELHADYKGKPCGERFRERSAKRAGAGACKANDRQDATEARA